MKRATTIIIYAVLLSSIAIASTQIKEVANNELGFFTNGAERLRIDSSGNMGVGIDTPSQKLHVVGNVNVTDKIGIGTNFTIRTNNSAITIDINDQDIIYISNDTNVGIGVITPGEKLSVDGNVNASGSISQGVSLDLGEAFTAFEALEPGDIVAVVDADSVVKASKDEAYLSVGVVSENPGFTLNKPGLTGTVMVALAGRVPVKVVGPVEAGDYITVSETPGIGVVAGGPCFVIGRALESSSSGLVTILIEPGY